MKVTPPSTEEILEKCEIPDELQPHSEFLEIWAEWVAYKQEEAENNGRFKPWNSLNAASRMLSEIRNRYMDGRDICHVISQSMLNQWIGIRFDLVPDRNKDVTLKNKSRDQLSQLDIEYFNINNNQKTLN
jgi:hypothetical protein